MFQINIFSRKDLTMAPQPNYWDVLAFLFIAAIIFAIVWLGNQMVEPFSVGEPITISLDPSVLPLYCLRSVSRIFISLIFSLLFTFIIGAAAAKSKFAEKIIIPFIDILQSVPVLGFLSVSIWGFLVLFPNSLLGPECAAIFAIFTAQVWNMILSFYQSLLMVPKSLNEASRVLMLSPWQRFWSVDVPFAMPSLLWNMMLSISASWFFMVASEAIEVGNNTILLPGIGSYIAVAIKNANISAVISAVIAMFITIFLYDQIFFRPIMSWGSKFRTSSIGDDYNSNIILKFLHRTKLARFIFRSITRLFKFIIALLGSIVTINFSSNEKGLMQKFSLFFTRAIKVCVFFIILLSILQLILFVHTKISVDELHHVIYLGALTSARVLIMILVCLILWVPIGVTIGLRSNIASKAQPIIQMLAAFPANLFFPLFVSFVIKYNLNIDIWLSPLMILGTQWYILFNVIAGALQLPHEQRYAIKLFATKKILCWRRFILPGILPHLVTGMMTAAGGAWNASILAEAVNWGNSELYARGLGAYITYLSLIHI